MSLVFDKKFLLNIYKAELLYKFHQALECIKLYETKYGKKFEEFEKQVKNNAENFDVWDDYMEWKACIKELETLKKLLQEVEDGNPELFKAISNSG